MRESVLKRGKAPGRGGCLVVAFALLCIMAYPNPGSAADGVRPLWTEGDTWTVRVVCPAQGGGWSSPVLWEYRVSGVPGTGFDRYLLEVSGPGAEATLTYRGDCSLEGVRITRALGKKRIATTLDYEAGAPVLTEQSPAPFDTPLFPLLVSSSGDYTARRKVGEGLVVTVTVTQTVVPAPGDEEILEVTCAWGEKEQFVQQWKAGRPWPVYGENRNMRYWLVEK